jgi:phosphoribosylanthranilate isomerase
MRIKICGLTRREDAEYAQKLGAWALGFVFYPKSPRHITPEKAADIIRHLTAPAVGVFVNQMDDVLKVAKIAGLKGIQLHGDETPEECLSIKKSFSGFVIKAFRPATEEQVEAIGAYKGAVDYILIDAAAGAEYGGTGKAADKALAVKAKKFGIPLILAGGLSADNIIDAVRDVAPFAADLSSGVESSPGIKDAAKLDELFKISQGENHAT